MKSARSRTFFTLILACAIALSACAQPAGPDGRAAAPGGDTTPAVPPPIVAPTLTPSPVVAPTQSATPQAPSTPSLRVAVATPTAEVNRSGGVVLGYYVPYDPSSWAALQSRADHLDYVNPQWATIDACGGISSRDDRTLIAFARSKGVKLLPSLLTLDPELNHRLLTDDQVRSRAIEQIVSYVVEEGYDGFDLDLEDVAGSDRQAYTAFVAKLSAALHARGRMLMAALPAKKNDATTGWSGAFDYAALGPHLDLAMLMTYDFAWSTSPPGSTAPNDWVDQVMQYATSQMPREKVLLGVAFYGYDWNTTTGGRARALRYSDAVALAKKYGKAITQDGVTRSATFKYQAGAGDTPPAQDGFPALRHDVKTRTAPICSKPLPTSTPAAKSTALPRPTATPAPVYQHEVWVENAASLTARLQVADKNRVGGIGAWRLGQEDPDVWQAIESWRRR